MEEHEHRWDREDEEPEIPQSPLNLVAFAVSLFIAFGLFGPVLGLVALPFVMAFVYAIFWNPLLAIGLLLMFGLFELVMFLAWVIPLVFEHILNALSSAFSIHWRVPSVSGQWVSWLLAAAVILLLGYIVFRIVAWILENDFLKYAVGFVALVAFVIAGIYGLRAGFVFLSEFKQASDNHRLEVSLDGTVSKVFKGIDPGDVPGVTPPAQPAKAGGFIWPVKGPITSHFGYRIHPIFGVKSFHTGIDIAAKQGTPVRAAASGKVVLAGYLRGYGYTIIIRHADGTYTLYAHLSRVATGAGKKVRRGQVIGYVGSTGWSTGPHLHFSIYRITDGRRVYINPEDVLP